MWLVLTHTLKCEEFLNCAITTMSTHSREPRFNKISPHDRWHLRRNYIKRFYCRKIFNIYGSLYFCLVYIREKKKLCLICIISGWIHEYTNVLFGGNGWDFDGETTTQGSVEVGHQLKNKII